MNPIKRELLNGLFVLVLASLMSAAFATFQVTFNVQLFVWIVIGVAVGFYVVFDLTLRYVASTEAREKESEESTRAMAEAGGNAGSIRITFGFPRGWAPGGRLSRP